MRTLRRILLILALINFETAAQEPCTETDNKWLPQTCDCKDSNDLLNRYNEAKAAIAEYQNQQKFFRGKMFDGNTYRNTIQPAVQSAINAVSNSSTRRAAGYTDPSSCNSYIIPKSHDPLKNAGACLRMIICGHEMTHKTECELWQRGHTGPRPFSDYRSPKTMHDVIQEEIASYFSEIGSIRIISREMNPLCRPPGITGVINYTRKEKWAATTVNPPISSKDSEEKITVDFERTHTAVISVLDGDAIALQTFSLQSRRNREVTVLTKCDSNPRTELFPYRIWSEETNEQSGNLASETSPARVEFLAGNRVAISFGFPGLSGQATSRRKFSEPACPNQRVSGMPQPPAAFVSLSNAVAYRAIGRGNTNDESLSGEFIDTSIPSQVVTVSWDLMLGRSRTKTVSWRTFAHDPPLRLLGIVTAPQIACGESAIFWRGKWKS